MEDVDAPRTVAGAAERIVQQLGACGLVSDEPVVVQSTRSAFYQQALDQLVARGLAYPCCCSRKDIANAAHAQSQHRERHAELVYPGTCRNGFPPLRHADTRSCAWRVRTDVQLKYEPLALAGPAQAAINLIACGLTHWNDRLMGAQQQHVANAVGDFVLKRADGCFTYQLAVVVDDGAQSISHVVRGMDLADNTARQVLLQQALGLSTPQYLHTPLVLGVNGEKLSKQNGAQAVDTTSPPAALNALQMAAQALGLPATHCTTVQEALVEWTGIWHNAHLATATRADSAA